MKLAEYQDLYYVKKVDFGVYLAEDMGGETHAAQLHLCTSQLFYILPGLPLSETPSEHIPSPPVHIWYCSYGDWYL